MARPKKVDSNQLIAMLDNYFTNVIEGDVHISFLEIM